MLKSLKFFYRDELISWYDLHSITIIPPNWKKISHDAWVELYLYLVYWRLKEEILSTVKNTWVSWTFSVRKLQTTDTLCLFLQFFDKKSQEIRGFLRSSRTQFFYWLTFYVSCNSPIVYWCSSINKTSREKQIFHSEFLDALLNLH